MREPKGPDSQIFSSAKFKFEIDGSLFSLGIFAWGLSHFVHYMYIYV